MKNQKRNLRFDLNQINSAINNLKFTQREIQLIAFTAISGNMSYKHIREPILLASP